ncbi:hypothetical protein [Paenibacillus oryzisoli]|nr:hypothetical protein [Paenibacillus oryzisoli]
MVHGSWFSVRGSWFVARGSWLVALASRTAMVDLGGAVLLVISV